MAPIVSTIDIARPPDEVFSYVTDPSRFAEWQENVVSGRAEGDPPDVGSRFTTTRRVGGSERTATWEIAEVSPRGTWVAYGVDGPIRALAHVTVEPLDDGERSRVTIALDFEGYGIGRVLVPLVARRHARRESIVNGRNLRERLEREG